jgi:hypothetical protein
VWPSLMSSTVVPDSGESQDRLNSVPESESPASTRKNRNGTPAPHTDSSKNPTPALHTDNNSSHNANSSKSKDNSNNNNDNSNNKDAADCEKSYNKNSFVQRSMPGAEFNNSSTRSSATEQKRERKQERKQEEKPQQKQEHEMEQPQKRDPKQAEKRERKQERKREQVQKRELGGSTSTRSKSQREQLQRQQSQREQFQREQQGNSEIALEGRYPLAVRTVEEFWPPVWEMDNDCNYVS